MNIITGEKIQQLCSLYIGDPEQYNPLTANDCKSKLYNIHQINTGFNNPYLIFCYGHRLEELAEKIDFFMNDFILFSHNSDFNIKDTPSVKKILDCARMQKWYAQNLCIEHEKLELLPIGIANSQWQHGYLTFMSFYNNMGANNMGANNMGANNMGANNMGANNMGANNMGDNNMGANNMHINKNKNVYFNFNIGTNRLKRQDCHDKLIHKLSWLHPVYQLDNLRRLVEYKFCICPEGNGADTHRLYEALYLKTVPIVIRYDFINVLQKYNVPLVVLDKWEDFDETKLHYEDYNFNDPIFLKFINFSYLHLLYSNL
jgi:hypothetical protein